MSCDDRPLQLKIDIGTVTRMTTDEVRWLSTWAAIKRTTFPHFAGWLEEAMNAELHRRSDPSCEAEMLAIPRLTAPELSDFMQGAYVLVRLTLTESQAKFADAISLLVMADIAAALETFDFTGPVT